MVVMPIVLLMVVVVMLTNWLKINYPHISMTSRTYKTINLINTSHVKLLIYSCPESDTNKPKIHLYCIAPATLIEIV